MTTFFDLFMSQSPPASDPAEMERRFQELLADSPFRPWQPGDPIVQRGERLLIGVAPWSGYDLRLLDVVAEALSSSRPAPVPVVEVFSVAACNEERDFRKYIPRLRHVFHTPVVGVWRNGRLDEAKEGYEARDLVARRFGADAAAVVESVQDWIKPRSIAP